MKPQKKIVVQRTEITVYVANDGTEFTNSSDCRSYEEERREKSLENSPDVIECKDAEDCPPFDGDEYYDHSYRWFKPLNTNGIELLNKLFGTSLNDKYIGEWLCLEICDDDIYTLLASDSVNYAKKMCEMLGIDDELDFMLDFAKSAEKSFDYDNNHELEMLRILWTAYCLHNNLAVDTDDYINKFDKIWSIIEDNISDNSRTRFETFMSENLR